MAVKLPTKPTDDTADDYNYKITKCKLSIKRANNQFFEDQGNNLQA